MLIIPNKLLHEIIESLWIKGEFINIFFQISSDNNNFLFSIRYDEYIIITSSIIDNTFFKDNDDIKIVINIDKIKLLCKYFINASTMIECVTDAVTITLINNDNENYSFSTTNNLEEFVNFPVVYDDYSFIINSNLLSNMLELTGSIVKITHINNHVIFECTTASSKASVKLTDFNYGKCSIELGFITNIIEKLRTINDNVEITIKNGKPFIIKSKSLKMYVSPV
jgi:hypothetical protein